MTKEEFKELVLSEQLKLVTSIENVEDDQVKVTISYDNEKSGIRATFTKESIEYTNASIVKIHLKQMYASLFRHYLEQIKELGDN